MSNLNLFAFLDLDVRTRARTDMARSILHTGKKNIYKINLQACNKKHKLSAGHNAHISTLAMTTWTGCKTQRPD